MFGISFFETTVILLLGFIVIGPRKMTDLAYEVGKLMNRMRDQLKYIKETQLFPLKDEPITQTIKPRPQEQHTEKLKGDNQDSPKRKTAEQDITGNGKTL